MYIFLHGSSVRGAHSLHFYTGLVGGVLTCIHFYKGLVSAVLICNTLVRFSGHSKPPGVPAGEL